MRALVEDQQAKVSLQFIGDSETDLLCLLEADTGIIMNSQSTVEKSRKLGFQVVSNLPENGDDKERKALRYVEDFRALLDA